MTSFRFMLTEKRLTADVFIEFLKRFDWLQVLKDRYSSSWTDIPFIIPSRCGSLWNRLRGCLSSTICQAIPPS